MRTPSIDSWTHREIDCDSFIDHVAARLSVRGLLRHFGTTVRTIQNRFGRLTRANIAIPLVVQQHETRVSGRFVE
jgi:hypothetical protein